MPVEKKISEIDFSNYDYIVIGSGISAFSFIQALTKSSKVLWIESGDKNSYPNNNIVNQVGYINDWHIHSMMGLLGTSVTWQNHILASPYLASEVTSWPYDIKFLNSLYRLACNKLSMDTEILNVIAEKVAYQENIFFNRPLWSCYFDENFFSLENFNENVDLILNCNIERLISRSNTIEAIEYQSNKKIGKFLVNKNQKVILAAGGISNAHILLKSDPKTLNKNGLVGRNLMEHPHGFVGHVVLDKNYAFNFDVPNIGKLRQYEKSICVSIKSVFDNKIRKVTLILMPKDIPLTNETNEKISKWLSANINFKSYALFCMSEQLPDLENRVSLVGNSKFTSDQNNLKIKTKCILSQGDIDVIEKAVYQFQNFLIKNKAGFGRFDNEIFSSVHGGGHVLGTTSISSDPKFGVVNKNLRHWHANNLYILGSSVLPTGGAVGPTLTIVGFAINLANNFNKGII